MEIEDLFTVASMVGAHIEDGLALFWEEVLNKILLSAVINSQGVTETLFDTNNQPIKITDPLGFVTQIDYSYKDPFTQTTLHPNGVKTLSIHDSRGRETLCLKKNAHDQIIQHSENVYDKNGNQIALIHTVFSGNTPIKTITHRWEYGPIKRLERFIEGDLKETRYLYIALNLPFLAFQVLKNLF